MGEWSKTVGEFGEKTVENFLQLIGWNDAVKGIDCKCLSPESHSENGDRRTHGVDYYYSYRSPLIDSVLKNVHISVKYTTDKYPNAPSLKFKSYFDELTYFIECFSLSETKREYSLKGGGFEAIENVGLIFWLSNSQNIDDDVIEKVAGIQVSSSKKVHSVLLIDNKRVEFIYRAIRFAHYRFPNSDINFFYPATGKNINPSTRLNYGKILPVEFINTSILPLRIEEISTGKVHLVLYSIDSFSIDDLKKLIGLSQELSGSWAGSVVLCFPDYNELLNLNEVRAAKSSFENKSIVDKLIVTRYNDTFKDN